LERFRRCSGISVTGFLSQRLCETRTTQGLLRPATVERGALETRIAAISLGASATNFLALIHNHAVSGGARGKPVAKQCQSRNQLSSNWKLRWCARLQFVRSFTTTSSRSVSTRPKTERRRHVAPRNRHLHMAWRQPSVSLFVCADTGAHARCHPVWQTTTHRHALHMG